MRQRDVAALDAKYTKELADAKLKMVLCVMMLPLVVVGCTSKQSVSQCVKPPPPPAWIMQPPRLADTAERDYFTLKEKAGLLCKNNWEGTQKVYGRQLLNAICLSMGGCYSIVSNTRASSGV